MKNAYELWYKYKRNEKQFELHWYSSDCIDLNETYRILDIKLNKDDYDWEIRKAPV